MKITSAWRMNSSPGVGRSYPVLCSSPEKAIATADEHIAAGHVPDIVFFDLPGTVNSEGVINSLAGMDYIFTPISADKVVLESSLSFAMAIQKLLVRNEACRLAGLYLFWNMVTVGRKQTFTPPTTRPLRNWNCR